MRKRLLIISMVLLALLMIMCSREKPWIGTYMLVVNDENREVFEMLQSTGTPWPHVTLKEDGTFTLIRPYNSGSGVYRIEDTNIVMTLTEYDGAPPLGNLAQSKTIQSRNHFQFILFEGPEGEPWIKLPEEE